MRSAVALTALVASASALAIKRQSTYSNSSASAPNPAVWESLRGKIKHVVYLMEEYANYLPPSSLSIEYLLTLSSHHLGTTRLIILLGTGTFIQTSTTFATL